MTAIDLSLLLPSPIFSSFEVGLLFIPGLLLSVALLQLVLLPLLSKNYTHQTVSNIGLFSVLLALVSSMIWLPYLQSKSIAQLIQSAGPLLGGLSWGVGSYYQLFILLVLSAIGVLLISRQDETSGFPFEVYPVFLLTMIGMYFLVLSKNLMVLFISMETISFGLYLLIAFKRAWRGALESALKYFFLGGLGSLFFLYGTVLYFGVFGTFNLSAFASGSVVIDQASWPLVIVSASFITAGLLFKVGAFPFHFWVPDVYHGAPSSLTSWMGAVVKLALFIVLLNVAKDFLLQHQLVLLFKLIFFIVGLCSIVIGHFMAYGQKALKRVLAHSAVAQSGYLLLAVSCYAQQPNIIEGMISYLTAYGLLNAIIFSSLLTWEQRLQRDVLWSDLSVLIQQGRSEKWHGFLFLVGLLGMAGFPLTVGFVGKLSLLLGILQSSDWWAAAIFLLGSALGLAYYIPAVILVGTSLLEASKQGINEDRCVSGFSIKNCHIKKVIFYGIQLLIILTGIAPFIFPQH